MAIKIKLWADYESYPIWGVDEIDNIAPEELPLSQATIKRLNAWQNTYDQTLNQDYTPLSNFPNQQAEIDFNQEGILLWQQLRLELSPDYEVFYQNNHQLFKHPNEITVTLTSKS
ncbi:MAG: hypothetical protein QNJ42_18550 [Crocosphaera sp.]|nr:hypothetical protein [Crocosphaera sp.]